MSKFSAPFRFLANNTDFRLLYTGQFVSFFGTMIAAVALPYQIYQLTHSTLMVGLLSLSQLIPLLFTALLGGVLADRCQRSKLLISSEVFLALGCLLLAWNSIHLTSVGTIFVISTLMSGITGLHRPALDSMVQQLVKKEDFVHVGALANFKFSIGMIVGPAVGGLMIAYLGIVGTYLMDFVSFAASLITLLLMSHIPKPTTLIQESGWKSFKGGWKYALSRQELMGTYCVDFVAMIFGMPNALFPAIAASLGGAKTLGLLYSAPALGSLIVSFFSGWFSQIKRHGLAIAIAAGLWGVAIIFFGLATNIWLALFFLSLAGAFDAISGIFRITMWNDIIPNDYRGRLAGIEMIGYLSGPKIGDAESGLIASAFGITAAIVSGGILCVFGVAITCYFMPKLLQYRKEGILLASNSEVTQ